MSDQSINLTIKNNVAHITLNRPEVFNSFNREMALRLQNTLDQCEQNNEVRAIVLTGAGKAFCAGQDLKEVTHPELNPGFKKILEAIIRAAFFHCIICQQPTPHPPTYPPSPHPSPHGPLLGSLP